MPRPATGQVIEKATKRGTMYALRFRALGGRQYVTLGTAQDGWNRQRAAVELENVMADVRRGIWRPTEPVPEVSENPTFHVYASAWLHARRNELRPGTVSVYTWALS